VFQWSTRSVSFNQLVDRIACFTLVEQWFGDFTARLKLVNSLSMFYSCLHIQVGLGP
jgi:hypothetical protein